MMCSSWIPPCIGARARARARTRGISSPVSGLGPGVILDYGIFWLGKLGYAIVEETKQRMMIGLND